MPARPGKRRPDIRVPSPGGASRLAGTRRPRGRSAARGGAGHWPLRGRLHRAGRRVVVPPAGRADRGQPYGCSRNRRDPHTSTPLLIPDLATITHGEARRIPAHRRTPPRHSDQHPVGRVRRPSQAGRQSAVAGHLLRAVVPGNKHQCRRRRGQCRLPAGTSACPRAEEGSLTRHDNHHDMRIVPRSTGPASSAQACGRPGFTSSPCCMCRAGCGPAGAGGDKRRRGSPAWESRRAPGAEPGRALS